MSDDRQVAVCRQVLAEGVLERVRDRIPDQTARQLINAMRRACAGLQDSCSNRREALASTGRQADAVTLAIEDVLLEELESWFEQQPTSMRGRNLRGVSDVLATRDGEPEIDHLLVASPIR